MSKTFCALPWNHLYIDTNGKFKICCMSDEYVSHNDGYQIFDVLRNEPIDVVNSAYMKSIRKKMIHGEKIDTCKKCTNLEDRNLPSRREIQNKDIFVSNTDADGHIHSVPSELELHFGNVCNLRCRMCSQYFSHSIGKELLKIEETDKEFLIWVKKQSGFVNNWSHDLNIIYDWFKNVKVKNYIFEHIRKHVKNLLLIGGEPTIIPEFWELINFLSDNNALEEMSITLVTNCTNINKKILEKIKFCKFFKGHLSVDGLYERNNYIRYPSDWNTILKNVLYYKELTENSTNKNDGIGVAPAWQILNIDQLVDILIFWNKLNVTINWQPTVVSPIILDYKNFPQSYQNFVADNLETKLFKNKNEIRNRDFKEAQNVIAVLRSKTTSNDQHIENVVKAFIKYNDKIDQHRGGLTWRKLLPDLVTHLEAIQKQ